MTKEQALILMWLLVAYQAGITTELFMQKAHATNESSYKYGYSAAFDGYKCAFTLDCDSPSSNPRRDVCETGLGSGVTNITACVDGSIAGWKAWCKTDMDTCLGNVPYGAFPDIRGILK